MKLVSSLYSGDLASLMLLLLVLKYCGLSLAYFQRVSDGCLQKAQMNEAPWIDCIW